MDATTGLIVIAVLGGALITLIGMIRNAEQRHADKLRTTYELFFPGTMSHANVLAFLRSLAGLPKPKLLQPTYAVSFERYADERGERYFVHLPGRIAARLDELFYGHIDGSLEPVKPEDDPVRQTHWDHAVELGMRGINKPLRIASPEATAVSMDAQFKNMSAGEAVCMQWVLFPARPTSPTATDKDKVGNESMFHAITRLAAVGERPQGMVLDISSVFRSVEAPGTHFANRVLTDVGGRINRRAGTFGFPIYMNAVELSALLGWPLNGTGARRAKRIAPTIAHDTEGIILGTSNSPKSNRPIAMPIEAGDMHVRVMGGSGVGKSNFLLNMGVQYMNRDDTALILIEPAGDLAWDMLKRVPEHRVKDVIYFDSLDVEYPIGLNPMRGSDPERMTGHIVSILKNMSGDSWSPQIQRVSTLTVMTGALTGCTFYDLRQLLVNEDFRNLQIKKINRNAYPDIIQEWHWLASKHDLVVDSTVNRLDAFLGSRMIRNMVSQQEGIDFDWIISQHKILLVPLPAAKMGQTNASAIGSLIREMAWNAAMKQPMDDRQRSVMMLDEFQNFADFSTSKSDPFAEARKFKQSYVIANQFTEQLPREVQYTVDKNVGTHIMFRLAPEEASKVKARFAPLSDDDLVNMPRYHAAARVMSSGGLAPTVTFKTAPPPPMTPYWDSIIANTRKTFAKPRAEVEADILTRHKSPEPKRRPSIGSLDDA